MSYLSARQLPFHCIPIDLMSLAFHRTCRKFTQLRLQISTDTLISHIPTLISHIPTLISHIPTLISYIPTLISHIPTSSI